MGRIEALLPLAIVFGLLAACGQQPAPAKPERPMKTAKSEIDEVDALIAATKQHPSLVNPKDAGAPIHIDPFPKSAGMAGHHHAAR